MMEQLMQQQEQIKEMQQSNDIQIQRDYQTDIELVMLLNKDS